MALSNRKVLLFKLEEGLEVNLIGRNFTVWGEIREPFKLLLGRECLCKFFCFVLLLCVSVCLCVCVCFVMQNASISMSVAQILLGQNFRF